MLRAYLPPFIIGVLMTFGLTYYIRALALKFKLFDMPSPRKVHSQPVPRLGGVAIILSFLILTIGYSLASERLSFGSEFLFMDNRILGMLIGLLVLFLVGLFDDIRGVRPFWKLFWHLVASIIVVSFGVSIDFIRIPFGLHLDLNTLQFPFEVFGYSFNIVFWGDLFSVLWIMLLINTLNFLDGLDGLATGIGAITGLAIFALSIFLAQDASALLAIIISGIALGFLPWNFNPAKIFLGDSGSMAIGYLLGVLSLISGGKMATAFLVLGIPVFDVGWVILRRLISGYSPFSADKRHFHHRLLTAGLTQKQAVVLLYIISVIFGSIAVIATTQAKITAAFILFILTIALALALVVLEYRKRKFLTSQK